MNVVSSEGLVVKLMVLLLITISVDLRCVIGCILVRGYCNCSSLFRLIILMVGMRNLMFFAMERHGLVSQIAMLSPTLSL